jgi:hypothetical protein
MYKSILASILSLCLPLSNFTLGTVEASARQDASPTPAAPLIPNDQLDSLVAPIALYPDPLLSQVLVASTYPLEIIQLQQWLDKHKGLTGDALVSAVEKEDCVAANRHPGQVGYSLSPSQEVRDEESSIRADPGEESEGQAAHAAACAAHQWQRQSDLPVFRSIAGALLHLERAL